MKYMLLIYQDPATDPQTAEEGAERTAEYGVFTEKIIASGELVAGDRLGDPETATSVRVRSGATTTVDGPFAETKEFLGGYYIVDVADLDRATELASQIPTARSATVEVRPIVDMGG